MKPFEAVSEDDIIRFAQELFLLRDRWGTVEEVLNAEALAAMRACTFDRELSRDHYAGYATALEFLATLPDRMEQMAEAIIEKRNFEEKGRSAAVASSLRSNYEGSTVSGT